MAKKQRFEDPLEKIDPIMEGAFSAPEEKEESVTEKKAKAPAKKTQRSHADETPVADVQFPTLDTDISGRKFELDVFKNIPVNLSVELGRSQISLKEVYELTEGAIIELERLVGEPLDLVVNGQIIAQGEVVAIDNNYGLRVTQIISQTETTY